MAVTIVLKSSNTASAVPLTTDISPTDTDGAELLINYPDKLIYTKNSTGHVVSLNLIGPPGPTGPTGPPGPPGY